MALSQEVTGVLKDTRALLASPGAWCQKANALDSVGTVCLPHEPQAKSWCLRGALMRHGSLLPPPPGTKDPELYSTVRYAIQLKIQQTSIVTWNDIVGRTQDEVLQMLDELISVGTPTHPESA